MQRFAEMIRVGLTADGHEVRFVRPEPFIGKLCRGETGICKWFGYFDRYILFPARLRRHLDWPDVVHICDNVNAVYVPYLKRVPHVVTCHDMMAIRAAHGDIPERETRVSGRIYQNWIFRNLQKSQKIVCVSGQTRTELMQMSDISAQKVAVVPNALNYEFRKVVPEETISLVRSTGYVCGQPFFLHVGGNQWYKNREGVIRIFHQLKAFDEYDEHQLAMIGKPWNRKLCDLVADLGLRTSVHELVGVSNEQLRAFYSTAEALIFPSLAEGFGWPIVEAQACGCPVFTSGREPMCWVGGNAARYFEPTDVAGSASAVKDGLCDREEMSILGEENASRFSTRAFVDGYLDAYSEVRNTT